MASVPDEPPPPCAVLYEDDVGIRRALLAHLFRYGFTVALVADSPRGTLDAVAQIRPDIIVLDLAVAGERGIGLLASFRDVARHAGVVVVSPFPGLRAPALAAGAWEVLDPSDLRPLEPCLVRALEQENAGCACCPPTTTATATIRASVEDNPIVRRQGQDSAAPPGSRGADPPAS